MSSFKSNKNLKQVGFLQKVLENKDVLFGKFTNEITRNTKQDKWTEMRNYAVSLGLITCDKDYSFVRDNTWGNIRKKTMVSLKYVIIIYCL